MLGTERNAWSFNVSSLSSSLSSFLWLQHQKYGDLPPPPPLPYTLPRLEKSKKSQNTLTQKPAW